MWFALCSLLYGSSQVYTYLTFATPILHPLRPSYLSKDAFQSNSFANVSSFNLFFCFFIFLTFFVCQSVCMSFFPLFCLNKIFLLLSSFERLVPYTCQIHVPSCVKQYYSNCSSVVMALLLKMKLCCRRTSHSFGL